MSGRGAWRIGGYVADELIGYGASAQVWRGHVGRGGAPVALKVLDLSDAAAVRTARAEAAVLSTLDHPHLVRLRELVPDGESIVLVLELAAGGTLADLLARRGRLSPGEVVGALSPVAAALAYAHDAGVVHCDVSPANVLFRGDGSPVLADLGVARLVGGFDAPRSTLAYVDPGVAAGGVPSDASDVFMVAATALHALTGAPPWMGATAEAILDQAAEAEIPNLEQRLAGLPTDVADVVRRGLDPSPAARGSAAEFALDLRHAAAPVPVDLDAGSSPFAAATPPGSAGPASTGPAAVSAHTDVASARAEIRARLTSSARRRDDSSDGIYAALPAEASDAARSSSDRPAVSRSGRRWGSGARSGASGRRAHPRPPDAGRGHVPRHAAAPLATGIGLDPSSAASSAGSVGSVGSAGSPGSAGWLGSVGGGRPAAVPLDASSAAIADAAIVLERPAFSRPVRSGSVPAASANRRGRAPRDLDGGADLFPAEAAVRSTPRPSSAVGQRLGSRAVDPEVDGSARSEPPLALTHIVRARVRPDEPPLRRRMLVGVARGMTGGPAHAVIAAVVVVMLAGGAVAWWRWAPAWAHDRSSAQTVAAATGRSASTPTSSVTTAASESTVPLPASTAGPGATPTASVPSPHPVTTRRTPPPTSSPQPSSPPTASPPTASPNTASPPTSSPVWPSTGAGWGAVLAGLDRNRQAAFAADDAGALSGVYVDGPLLAQDRLTLHQVVGPGCHLIGLRTTYTGVQVDSVNARRSVVTAHASLSESRLECARQPTRVIPAHPPVAMTLVLARVGERALIAGITIPG